MRGAPANRSSARRRLLAAVAAIVAGTFAAAAPGAHASLDCRLTNTVGGFGSGKWPSDCWRPYSATSPFNLRLQRRPLTARDSSQTVRAAVGGGDAAYVVAGDPKRPDGIAVYYGKPTDPAYTLHCTESWGTCPIEGMRVHVPEGA